MKNILKKLSPAGWVSLAIILLIVIIAVFAPFIASHDPTETSVERVLKKEVGYLLGCDQLGQCVYSRLVYGARLSLIIGFAARFVALLIGLVVGLTAGYYGGWIDWGLMRIVDMFLAFPSLLLAIAISLAMGSGVGTVIFAIAISGWAEMARIIRSSALELRNAEYVTAAKTMGSSDIRIVLTHILPNCFPIVIVIFTMGIATAVLAEASLSFLGLGVDSSVPTWGGMVSSGNSYLMQAPGLVFWPGLCIALLVISFNILGDELRDILDPSGKSKI